MIPGLRRVVADGTGAVLQRTADRIARVTVQTGDVVDHELPRVEDRLTPRNRLPVRRLVAGPVAEQGKHQRVQAAGHRGAGLRHGRKHAQRIVDADAEGLARQRMQTTAGGAGVQTSRSATAYLRDEQSELEVDD